MLQYKKDVSVRNGTKILRKLLPATGNNASNTRSDVLVTWYKVTKVSNVLAAMRSGGAKASGTIGKRRHVRRGSTLRLSSRSYGFL